MTDSMRKYIHYMGYVLCAGIIAAPFIWSGLFPPGGQTPPQPPAPRTETVPDPSKGNTGLPTTAVRIDGLTITAEIAETPGERARGLSHRPTLAAGSGMLFIFTHDAPHPFWMRDTFIPLDIIWIDAGKKIVHIEREVTPETYPDMFTPSAPARYALEVPAGYAAANGIGIGGQFRWEHPHGRE